MNACQIFVSSISSLIYRFYRGKINVIGDNLFLFVPIMTTSKLVTILIIVVLSLGNVFFIVQYTNSQRELTKVNAQLQGQKGNKDVLEFAKLFVSTVLNAEKEIDFETRLSLENAVRNLKDAEILAQWQNFVNSATEAQAQREVKRLLQLLLNKMSV